MAAKEKQDNTAKTAPKYTAAELAKASKKVFNVSPDIVTAAFRMAGVKDATIEEARDIVTKFAKKEVK